MTEEDNENFSISEVVQRFSGEFEISDSNLRFWEKEGLLSPRRSRGGHRLYSEQDVEKIRLIHKLKTERYLPLAMIKRFISSGMPLTQVQAHLDHAAEHLRPIMYDPEFKPCTLSALAECAGLSQEVAERMIAVGFLAPQGEGLFDEDDLYIAKLFRLSTEMGFEPEDFSSYIQAMEAVAREQVKLASRGRPPQIPSQPQSLKYQVLVEDLPRYLLRKALLRAFKQLDESGFFDQKCHQMKGKES
ncbi:MAG TPA: MerR family transcriptional regulator [Chroococcales cyanobacterium]